MSIWLFILNNLAVCVPSTDKNFWVFMLYKLKSQGQLGWGIWSQLYKKYMQFSIHPKKFESNKDMEELFPIKKTTSPEVFTLVHLYSLASNLKTSNFIVI